MVVGFFTNFYNEVVLNTLIIVFLDLFLGFVKSVCIP